MNVAQPIRDEIKLREFKNYYLNKKPSARNYLLITFGLNTALRISDILLMKWKDVFDFETYQIRTHIEIKEMKTGKNSKIYINANLRDAIWKYKENISVVKLEDYLFPNNINDNVSISRVQAHRIVKEAASFCKLDGTISCHSLRKTFGYHAWKQGISPVLLMNIYNHSSFDVTKHYLGIDQDDRDFVFENILL